MTNKHNVHSLRHKFLLIMGGTMISFIVIAILITSKYFIDKARMSLQENAYQVGELISSFSIEYLKRGDFETLEKQLYHLDALKTVNHVHVYKGNQSDGSVTFFTSYKLNRSHSAIEDKIDQIETLATPRSSNNVTELMVPIIDNSVIGYAYVQLDNTGIKELVKTLILALVVVIVFTIIICLYISYYMYQQVSQPINKLTNTIQHVSQFKDYQSRCDPMNSKEFDILSQNINIMLSRTEKHLETLFKSKIDTTKLNTELEEKVAKRTSALKESNQELLSTLEKLHQFQGKLIESEKMASLGDMVAGVAHEVNTPIGLGVTASTLMSDRLNDIKQAFEEKTLKSSQLKHFLAEGEENVAIICRNLVRAADLISSFKKVAVDQSSDEIRTFDFAELLSEVQITLGPQVNYNLVNITIDCPSPLVVTSKPGPINQIFINLILNAVIHGFDKSGKGNISIQVIPLGKQLSIKFSDDGKGIDDSIRHKVFEPFITTKRGSGGSGLGLHLVYNLITQALGGSIEISTEFTEGTTFEIYFPID